MKFQVLLSALTAALLVLPAAAADSVPGPVWKMDLDHLQTEPAEYGSILPVGWDVTGEKLGVPMTQCSVVQLPGKATRVLQISCNKSTGGIIYKTPFDLHKTPILRWRWRVLSLPAGADGRNEKKDDQPVAIYVGMNSGLRKKSFAYRWETETPVGYSGKASYGAGIVKVDFLVLRNQTTPCGEWVEECRNVAEDFQAAFGKIPDEVALSIIGNSQYTGSNTVAEVEFIEFSEK